MERQVGVVKRNAATEVADMVKQLNAERGAAAGRISGAPVTALTGPRVSSAEMLAGPRELTPAEAAEQADLDRKAREIGILPPAEEGEVAPENRMTAREIMEAALPPQAGPVKVSIPALSAGVPLTNTTFLEPRLPDFTKIQGIDLIRNVAYVDTFEIPLSEEFVKEVKGVILDLAVDLVTAKLAEAIKTLNLLPQTTGGPENGTQIETPTEVQREREGSSEAASE